MTKTTGTLLVLALGALLSCGTGAAPEPVEPTAGPSEEEAAAPAILERPFSAEQIRDEWIEGFTVTIRRWTPEAEVFERWVVIAADADGVDIESTVTDADGTLLSEPTVQHSSWVDLRDHASFPADRATREAVVRETPLGELHGWLYTVTDPASGVVTEFFFADDLPGAPVFVHVLRDGEVVEIFEQVERSRPE